MIRCGVKTGSSITTGARAVLRRHGARERSINARNGFVCMGDQLKRLPDRRKEEGLISYLPLKKRSPQSRTRTEWGWTTGISGWIILTPISAEEPVRMIPNARPTPM
jgi:hypothetical protein